MLVPTPSAHALPHNLANFPTIAAALDYAAKGDTGQNFYSARGELVHVLPYRDLRERALRVARGLAGLKLGRGARVALIADTEPDFVTLFFACQYAGLLPVPLPLPTSLGGKDAYIAQLRQQITNCEASLAWAPSELAALLAEAARGHCPVLESMDALSEEGQLLPWQPEDVGYLQFSSGSTRFPKGIEITQAALMANLQGIAQHGLQLRPGDRACSWLPFYHDMGLVGFLLAALATQTSIDYMATRDFARRPLTWLSLMARNRGSIAYSPSFGYELCVRRMRDQTAFAGDLSSWRLAGIGGDMVQAPVLDRFAACFAPFGFTKTAFTASYGMAETVLAISFAPVATGPRVDHIDRRALAEENRAIPSTPGEQSRGFVSCGRVLPGHAVEIRDPRGTPLGERQIGGIFFRGPSLMRGYFRQPEETRAVLDAQGWLNTGDLGYRWGDEIVITGRAKDLIIVNGRNIWPQDLEWAAEEVADLRRGDAAAFSIDDGQGDEQIILLVQCRSQESDSRDRLVKDVAARLQKAAAVEAKIILIPPHGLPKTSSGKLSRAKAKSNFLAGLYA
ncbi:MAG TPA: fatty acyl-AMP ligase [Dongiaceae bacterium]|jgi:fatty-acyl-CoA synthase|nr:fatty acyl-AMP ligase [Dongiaceae bacterium]